MLTYSSFKRIVDVAVAATMLLLAAPLMLFIALMIRLIMGKPVLFRQMRPGLHECPFRICKFRTMTCMVERNGRRLTDQERIGRLGRILRTTSCDELPELWNVIRGEMSLVGPRPLLMKYLPYYTADEQRRHSVRPGLTGWAQIQGRNELSFDRRLALDVWYVDHISFRLDLRILFRTAWAVVSRQGYRDETRSLDQIRQEVASAADFAASPHRHQERCSTPSTS